MGPIISVIIGFLIAALVIYIVGRLNLGLTIDGYGAALIAAIVIAIISAIVNWLLGILGIRIAGGWLAAIVYFVVAALVLMFGDRFVSGMKVNGFTGALIAAVAIAALSWLVTALLGPVMPALFPA